ncbi:MAG: hypothetical protein ACOCQ3_02300 [Natronomonas sp.]
MTRWIRIGAWVVLGLLVLWVVSEIMQLFLGFLSWVISTVVSLILVILVLYLIYLGVSKFLGRRTGSSNRLR